MNYQVWWSDRKLVIQAEGWSGSGSRQYLLVYPLVWNWMLLHESHISFDVATGELVEAFVTCADLLGGQEWFRQAWVELLGDEFWTHCMELVEADDHTLSPLLLGLNRGDQMRLARRWDQLYELALEVDIEAARSGGGAFDVQPKVSACRRCRAEGFLEDSTQTVPLFCSCVYGARALLEQVSCLGPMPNAETDTVLKYWNRARVLTTAAPTTAYVTLEQVDAARDRLLARASVTSGT